MVGYEAADDYNDDGEIDEEDFKLFVDRLFEGRPDGPFPGDGPFVPDFEDWLASEAADDYERRWRDRRRGLQAIRRSSV